MQLLGISLVTRGTTVSTGTQPTVDKKIRGLVSRLTEPYSRPGELERDLTTWENDVKRGTQILFVRDGVVERCIEGLGADTSPSEMEGAAEAFNHYARRLLNDARVKPPVQLLRALGSQVLLYAMVGELGELADRGQFLDRDSMARQTIVIRRIGDKVVLEASTGMVVQRLGRDGIPRIDHRVTGRISLDLHADTARIRLFPRMGA